MRTDQLQTRSGVFVRGHDHVLKEIAQQRFDGTLVSAFHVEIVRHGTQLADCTVGLRQNHAGGVTVTGTRGIQLFERSEPGSECGEVVFASPELARERLVLRPRGCQARFVDRRAASAWSRARPVRRTKPPRRPLVRS